MEVFSAGVETHGVNPRAVATMKEDGIDISNHTSNNLNEYRHLVFDYILTVCDHASEVCPVFPGNATRVHQNFPDPAKATGSEASIQASFRKVRAQIKQFCQEWIESIR